MLFMIGLIHSNLTLCTPSLQLSPCYGLHPFAPPSQIGGGALLAGLPSPQSPPLPATAGECHMNIPVYYSCLLPGMFYVLCVVCVVCASPCFEEKNGRGNSSQGVCYLITFLQYHIITLV